MDRRFFLSNLALFSGGLALASSGMLRRTEVFAETGDVSQFKAAGYGELIPTATKNTGEIFLALPKGFEYHVFGKAGSRMSDGRTTPGRHDGMRTFTVGGELRLVRNHEVVNSYLPKDGAGIGASKHYDETCGGGTTTLVIDRRTNTLVRDFVSLSGTLINCAGGRTPWGSWISCEETTLGPTVRTSSKGVKTGGFAKPHGYCFEVPASANGVVDPVPLKAMGRFTHEAVAVDKRTGVVYETEDANTSGFYRFLPNRKKKLAEGGTLQMLAVKGQPDYDTRKRQKVGASLEAIWVTIPDPDPATADVDSLAVYKQGKAKGGATFARLEGCEIDGKARVYFTATSGGDNQGGQIWLYEPEDKDSGRLKLLFESPDPKVLYMPDNICLMPNSDLLFICEDSDYAGMESVNHMRILTPSGKMADLARNISKDAPRSEFAGATFSPDGKVLFLNLYQPGETFAIWGDWGRFRI
jgi:secreted PhoX family phosphatase